ncbi:hypothetical protein [Halobacteriovorax sp. ZH2_bin.1]|uniref:hypothetical protein n=1 Tax=Halobacteriovorax sp. ZH2_bin.1 TaxID=3157724 RepID=UPI003714EAB4
MTHFILKDLGDNSFFTEDLTFIINEINRDRTDSFDEYNEDDWEEGWTEWCQSDFYSLEDRLNPREISNCLNSFSNSLELGKTYRKHFLWDRGSSLDCDVKIDNFDGLEFTSNKENIGIGSGFYQNGSNVYITCNQIPIILLRKL